YENRYKQEAAGKEMPKENQVVKKRDRPQVVFNQLHINSDASKIAFVRNNIGKYKVCLKDLKNDKGKKLFKGGFKNITQPIDYSQPLVSFDPTGKKLAIVYEKRSEEHT